ncbi:hypothetical protein [Schumannella soli]|uniref:Uncharacterized protein n=1 Tax=Schumannella soli TaxID=2590779 RepID=A0A506XYP1_9MICO|nr:hypothetical protein [Schumannella soli]TPW77871.1 hypothetical protein FJ657_04280 [Schumannella soli]
MRASLIFATISLQLTLICAAGWLIMTLGFGDRSAGSLRVTLFPIGDSSQVAALFFFLGTISLGLLLCAAGLLTGYGVRSAVARWLIGTVLVLGFAANAVFGLLFSGIFAFTSASTWVTLKGDTGGREFVVTEYDLGGWIYERRDGQLDLVGDLGYRYGRETHFRSGDYTITRNGGDVVIAFRAGTAGHEYIRIRAHAAFEAALARRGLGHVPNPISGEPG